MSVDDRKKTGSVIKFVLRAGIVFFLILASMRFYAGYLEQEIADISRAIEQISMQETSLKQQLSALTSPNRIYSYCLDILKMQKSTGVGILKIKKTENE